MMNKSLRVSIRAIQQRSLSTSKPVTREEVLAALDNWGKGLVAIATEYEKKGDFVGLAKNIIKSAYGYDNGVGEVLFKPTLADQVTFRKTAANALSYFVGQKHTGSGINEDNGFAINPWIKADFEIAGVITGENHGIVMGNKLLTKKPNDLVKANFTMGFIRNPKDGKLLINLHHSSLPYKPN